MNQNTFVPIYVLFCYYFCVYVKKKKIKKSLILLRSSVNLFNFKVFFKEVELHLFLDNTVHYIHVQFSLFSPYSSVAM